ncbi:MAG: AmmeMemoRadiSam system protein A [Candidatus Pacearchaeota archaeon]
MLTKKEKQLAKELAKLSIEMEFKQDENILKKISEIKKELNKYNYGVFVTLKNKNQLRGCIGFPYQTKLGEGIYKAAKLSAFYDPRFMPLTKEELNDISIEITILFPTEEIKTKDINKLIKEIKIGKHGLIIKNKDNIGLLLPQVALEYNLNVIDFIEQTCIKAGLNRNAWLDENTKIFKFIGIYF